MRTNRRGTVKFKPGKLGDRGDIVINDGMGLLAPATPRDDSLQLISEAVPLIIQPS